MAWGLAHISSRELAEWQAFSQLEPLREERADWRMASLAALIANIYRDSSRRSEPYTTQDFMPQWGKRETEEQTPEQMLAMVQMWNTALQGQDLRQKRGDAG